MQLGNFCLEMVTKAVFGNSVAVDKIDLKLLRELCVQGGASHCFSKTPLSLNTYMFM